MGHEITHNKTTFLSAVSAPAVVESSEIDLGLSIGILARILGIHLHIDTAPIAEGIAYGEVSIRLDPEATTANISLGLDDIIAFLRQRVQCNNATIDVVETGIQFNWDFTNMNMLVARNLAMICSTSAEPGDAPAFNAFSFVRYELYKPTAQELNEIIAYRR
ncbi:hypothetical protein ES703_117569 [subsurface metagenome]